VLKFCSQFTNVTIGVVAAKSFYFINNITLLQLLEDLADPCANLIILCLVLPKDFYLFLVMFDS